MDRAAHRGEHRKGWRRHRAGRSRAVRRRPTGMVTTACSSGSWSGTTEPHPATRPQPTPRRGERRVTVSPESWRASATRSSTWTSPSRRRSAPSSSAGSSRRRSRVWSSAINPFDEPNVAESKRNTEEALDEHRRRHALPARRVLAAAGPLAVVGDRQTAGASAYTSGPGADRTVAGELRRHVDRIDADRVLATPGVRRVHTRARRCARRHPRAPPGSNGRPTTAGYGPRFLHSTGQLHKGGTPSGWFLQLVAGHPRDLVSRRGPHVRDAHRAPRRRAISPRSRRTDCPCLRVHLSDDPDEGSGLAALLELPSPTRSTMTALGGAGCAGRPARARVPSRSPPAIIIFGATGDLTHRKVAARPLQPATGRAAPARDRHRRLRPPAVHGETFRAETRRAIAEHSRVPIDDAHLGRHGSRHLYQQGDFDDSAAFGALAKRLDSIGRRRGTHGNRLMYLATPPAAFAAIVENLGRAGLRRRGPRARLVAGHPVEKPFGQRPRLGAAPQPRGRPGLPRVAGVSHRPLPRQGNGPQRPRLPLRERDLRAGVEPPLRRSRADHGGRIDRRRARAGLLRGSRRDPRDILQNHAHPAASA